jgi:hypothetical protein
MSSSPIELRKDDSFVTLVFHYVQKAPIPHAKNTAARLDRLTALGISSDEDFNNWYKQDFMTSIRTLKTVFKTDKNYIDFKKKNKKRIIFTKIAPFIPAVAVFAVIIYFTIIGGFSQKQQIGGLIAALLTAFSLAYTSNRA